jgi:small subunit ribosomal protein S18
MSNDQNRRGGRRGGRQRYYSRPRVDPFEADKSLKMDWKDVNLLQRFITREGKIRPRRQTGVNAKNQRKLAKTIKRARHMALLPFASESLR